MIEFLRTKPGRKATHAWCILCWGILSLAVDAWAVPCDLPSELEAISTRFGTIAPPAPLRAPPPPIESPTERILREAYPEIATQRAINAARKSPSNRFMSVSAPPPQILAGAQKLNALEPGSGPWGEALEQLQHEVDDVFKVHGFKATLVVEGDGVINAVVQAPKKAIKGAHWIHNLAYTLSRRKPPHQLVFEVTDIARRTGFYDGARRQIGLPWGTPMLRAMNPRTVHEIVHYNQNRVRLAKQAGLPAGSLARQPISVEIVTPTRPFTEAQSGVVATKAEEMFGGSYGHFSEEYESFWRETKMASDAWNAEMKRIDDVLRTTEKLLPGELGKRLPSIEAWIEKRLAEAEHARVASLGSKRWLSGMVGHDAPVLDEAIARLESGGAQGALKAGQIKLDDGSIVRVDFAEISARHPGADLAADGDQLLLDELKRLRAHQQSRMDAWVELEKNAENAPYSAGSLRARRERLRWLAQSEEVSFQYRPSESPARKVSYGQPVRVRYRVGPAPPIEAYGVFLQQENQALRFFDLDSMQETRVQLSGLGADAQLIALFKQSKPPVWSQQLAKIPEISAALKTRQKPIVLVEFVTLKNRREIPSVTSGRAHLEGNTLVITNHSASDGLPFEQRIPLDSREISNVRVRVAEASEF